MKKTQKRCNCRERERERERELSSREIAFVCISTDNKMDYQSRDGPSFL